MAQTLRSSIKGALNRSIKGGLLSPAQFRGSTLDLDFAGAKSLKNQIGKEDVVSFTRASSGTYVGSDGLIKTATTNEARFDHDPTTGESLGLLVEEQRSNLLLNSGTLATQDVTVTAVAHTLSFYGSGTVTLSGTHTATVVGTGAYPARTKLTFTPTAGTLTVTVSGTVEYANLEIGSFATSYIPTTGSTVTRAADVASITGANFSSWYRQDEGSAFVDFTINGVNTGNNFIYDFSNGTTDEEIFLNYQDTGNARWVARIAGVQTTQNQKGAGLPRFKHAFGMASNNYMVARDGILSTGSSQVGMPSNTSLRLGARFSDSAASNGTIRRLVYWGQRLPNSTLQAITQ